MTSPDFNRLLVHRDEVAKLADKARVAGELDPVEYQAFLTRALDTVDNLLAELDAPPKEGD